MSHGKSLPQMMGLTLGILLLVGCSTSQPAPAASTPKSSKITLYYEERAQVELVSPQGTRVLIDVFDPSALTSPATEKDVLLTTHGHQDHIDRDFSDSFPGQQLRIREGEINLSDVTITGIASAHTAYDSDEFKPEGGTNYIFTVDMGGLRIVHFGDIGQDQLTQEQLDALGTVDIAITQFVNSFSQMDLGNKKGFNLMAQVKPKLVIPTHGGSGVDVVEYAMELGWEVFAGASEVTIGRADLSDTTRYLVLGESGPMLKKIFDLPEW